MYPNHQAISELARLVKFADSAFQHAGRPNLRPSGKDLSRPKTDLQIEQLPPEKTPSCWEIYGSESKVVQALALVSLLSKAAQAFPCTVDAFNSILPENAITLFAYNVQDNGTFGVVNDTAYPKNATNLPPLCAVSINVTSSKTSSFRFGIYLPTQWNGRMYTVGNGGFAGGINWLDMAAGTGYGFACLSTDTGHNATSSEGTWAYDNSEGITDWAGRAMHNSIVMSKSIISQFYQKPIQYSYYSGCSTGGYQGLKEIQTHPESFDGALIGSPAWWHSHLQTWSIQINLWNLPNETAHSIPQSLFSAIQAEVMRQCDGADGVMDGIISTPDRCDFHLEALLCTPSSNQSACLTSPQIETLSKLYGNWIETNQTFGFPNMNYGSEWQWSLVHDGGGDDQFSPSYVRNIVYNNPDWSIWNFSYDTVRDAERVNRMQGLDADNFDLSPFNARGGKLLHYVGLADGFIPAGSSEYYYNHVVRALAPNNISVQSFYRLFEIPGMGHCAGSGVSAPWYINGAGQAGSVGSNVRGVPGFNDNQHDAVLALMKWVEGNTAPTALIATKFTNDTDYTQGIESQRSLCPYPKVAVLDGGDMTLAESWVCANGSDYALFR